MNAAGSGTAQEWNRCPSRCGGKQCAMGAGHPGFHCSSIGVLSADRARRAYFRLALTPAVMWVDDTPGMTHEQRGALVAWLSADDTDGGGGGWYPYAARDGADLFDEWLHRNGYVLAAGRNTEAS